MAVYANVAVSCRGQPQHEPRSAPWSIAPDQHHTAASRSYFPFNIITLIAGYSRQGGKFSPAAGLSVSGRAYPDLRASAEMMLRTRGVNFRPRER